MRSLSAWIRRGCICRLRSDSALLLLLQQEPGWQESGPLLAESAMNSVDLSEVPAKLLGSGRALGKTRDILEHFPIEIHDFTANLAYRAAELRGPRSSSLDRTIENEISVNSRGYATVLLPAGCYEWRVRGKALSAPPHVRYCKRVVRSSSFDSSYC